MELEILASAPASLEEMPDVDIRESDRGQDDTTWRLDLDSNPRRVKPRQLISGGGKVLRPFTILPSTNASSDRERLAGEVFRESWRLPTMTIDEYLAEEQRQGNIITVGGVSISSCSDTNSVVNHSDKHRTMLLQKASYLNLLPKTMELC